MKSYLLILGKKPGWLTLALALSFSVWFMLERTALPPAPSASPALAENTATAMNMATPVWDQLQRLSDPPRPLSDRIAEYHVTVRLEDGGNSLLGNQEMVWRNPGSRDVQELYIHLYPNAFQSRQSTFIRESGGKLRGDRMQEDSYGDMRILAVTAAGGARLEGGIEYVRPDDGNPQDRTLIRLPLPHPVKPGETVSLQVAFEVKLPYVFARMGYAEDFVMAGQWFPKFAVYEPKGTRGRSEEGWSAHQYHGNSEFYSDFALYNVRVQVPEGHVVAATGLPVKPAAVENGWTTYHFYAEDVHDFAWAASPHFVYAEQSYSTPDIPGVKIKLYLDPRHSHLTDRYFYAAKRSLARYSEWYGPYPYSTLSIVVPPPGAGGAGGMEYPTLITAWAADHDNPGFELERVVVHEIGHQFWYGMVASNEFEEAWLDEGFTSYAEDKVMMAEYGLRPSTILESSYMTDPAPLTQNSWDYRDHDHYADNVYIRGKLILYAIEQLIGEERMRQVLQTYFQQWSFAHPSTRDFQTVLEQTTGRSWDDFFQQFVYGGQMADYAVKDIRVIPVQENGKFGYESSVIIERRGGHYMPVPVLIQFADGTRSEQVWEGSGERIVYKLIHHAPVEWVMVDPQYKLVLEHRTINNFLRTEADPTWKVRLNIGLSKIVQTVLGLVAW